MQNLSDKIESLVQAREKRKAKSLIVLFLRKRKNVASILKAAQWYRRLSLYRDGLYILMRENPFDKQAPLELKIQTAEFLSIIGSNHFALSLIKNLRLNTSSDYEIAAGIFYAAYDYKTALLHFKKRIELAKNESEYELRLTRLSIADCLSHLNEFKEAIKIGSEVLQVSSETLLVAICKQALGEYHSRSGNFETGLHLLNESLNLFPGRKETYDHALLFRWLGYTHIKMNQLKLGKAYLKESSDIIKKTSHREEIWLENIKMALDLGLLTPAIKSRLFLYPGLAFNQKLTEDSTSIRVGNVKSKIQIYLFTNEFSVQDQFYLGIPLEVKLLAYLRIAEDWGFGFEVAKVALWPDEAQSYLHLEDRLNQLIKRLKKIYKIKLHVDGRRMYLPKEHFVQISVLYDPSDRLPKKIQNLGEFTAIQLQSLYHLQRTQAVKWIGDFVKQNLVSVSGNGPARKYLVQV